MFSVLYNILVLFYKVIIFLLFKGYCDKNLNKYYISYPMDSRYIVCISQECKTYKQYQKISFFCAHEYNDMNRNSYHSSKYIVKPGDTLFYISWISGKDYIYLARINNIKNVNQLKVGQILKLYSVNKVYLNSEKLLTAIFSSINNCNLIVKRMIVLLKKKFLFFYTYRYSIFDISGREHNMIHCHNVPPINMYNSWMWPTCGKVIDTFSESEGGNKGIDISGKFGQPILAATSGKVVYVGNVLQGYGNLIIIEHDNDYLSAYAHNDMILVSEQQAVRMGDKIATMGNSGTNKIKLHFAIKHKGKSVNPLHYLSKN